MKKGYMMIKLDLAAAGIPYEVDGKFADFHSLRHSTASLLIQTGANPKVVQSLMRHSDLNLTMSKYTHLYAGQQRGAVESLPDFIVQKEAVAKTGTDDKVMPEKNCPKTANQSEKFRTNPNNYCDAETLRNADLDASNHK